MKTILVFPVSPLSLLGRPSYPEVDLLRANGIQNKISVFRDLNHFVVDYVDRENLEVGVVVLNLDRVNASGCLEGLKSRFMPFSIQQAPKIGVYSLPMREDVESRWLDAGINMCLPIDRNVNPHLHSGRRYAAVVSTLVGPQRLEGDAIKKPSSASTLRP